MAVYLRLPDFFPGLLGPPEVNLVLTVGIYFLLFALYTLTITFHPRTLALVVGVHAPPRWIIDGNVAPLPTPFLVDSEGPENALSLEAFKARPSFHASAANYASLSPQEEPDPDVVGQRREHQVEKVAKRDEEFKAKCTETIAKAKCGIDEFYEQCNGKEERETRENQF
ncbi:hypothetical protein FRC06_007900, partial [Ceratobasidium sp. 370]